jgi:hypothetical protein
MTRLPDICFACAMVAILIGTGVSRTMQRLVSRSAGIAPRLTSRELVREYRARYGQDRNYWAYRLSWLMLGIGLAGFVLLPK